MITAIVLINAERDSINDLAETLAGIDGISEVFSVSGRYDLVALIRVKQTEDMAELVTNRLLKLKGIINTETMLAFRAFSRFDLEHMFSIGFSQEK